MANAETPVSNKPANGQQVHLTLSTVMDYLVQLDAKIDALGKAIDDVTKNQGAGAGGRKSQREMTDDDARKVLTDLKDVKHNEAADKLGLSYGQVYSCRLGYTFKHIRKELTDAGVKNQWLEKTHAD